MSLERLDILIDKAREQAIAKSYSSSHGLQQEFFIVSANNAIRALQRHLSMEVAECFADYAEDSIVANQEAYSNPPLIFARHLIYEVEFSVAGLVTGYYPLNQAYRREFRTAGQPQEWFQDAGSTYIWPVPSAIGGKIRRRYEKILDSVDVQRGRVVSTTGAAPAYATIVLETTAPAPDAKLQTTNYTHVNVVDWDGTMKCRNIPITAYASATRTLTIKTGFLAATGESIAAGDYITLGKNAVTHPTVDPCAEDFFILWMIDEAQAGRSSTDTAYSNSKIKEALRQIAEVYSQKPAGKAPIPEYRGDW